MFIEACLGVRLRAIGKACAELTIENKHLVSPVWGMALLSIALLTSSHYLQFKKFKKQVIL